MVVFGAASGMWIFFACLVGWFLIFFKAGFFCSFVCRGTHSDQAVFDLRDPSPSASLVLELKE